MDQEEGGSDLRQLEVKRNYRYETLDEALKWEHLAICRRLIFCCIETVKLSRILSKESELRINYAMETAILEILNGKWER